MFLLQKPHIAVGVYLKTSILWGSFNGAVINPLKTKRKPLYLKTQFVPRSKHFSSRL